MTRVTEISDKFFNRDDAGMTLSEFASGLIAAETRNGKVGVNLTSPQDFVVNGHNVYPLLSDRGNGRIYDGLKSLELMSRTIKGVGLSATSLFDARIIAFTADDMKVATLEIARDIVNTNIGVKAVLDFAKSINSPEMTAYNNFVDKVIRDVKAGIFKTEEYITEALIRVKALVKSAMNTNRTIR